MRRLFASILMLLGLAGNAWSQGLDQVYRKTAGGKPWGAMLLETFGHAGYSESYALVVGISSFEHFRNLPTEQDAIRVKDFLIDEAGFDYVHLLTEDKVTYGRLRELMDDEFPTLVDANDRFLLYWSGHGTTRDLPAGGKRGYLPLGESRAEQFSGMVSMESIRGWNENLEAGQVLYLLDACFSGLAGSAVKAVTDYQRLRIDQLAKPGRHLLTAGTEDEETIALDKLGGSVFTAAVLDGLRGAADASNVFPNDGLVSVSELELYVNERVLRERTQAGWQKSITPQLRDLGASNGEFFFITAKRLAETGDMPPAFSPDQRMILEAQEILTGLGYEPGPRDGILGLRTLGAIRRFQSETGLSATGALDSATLAALIDAWADKPPASGMGVATQVEPADGPVDAATREQLASLAAGLAELRALILAQRAALVIGDEAAAAVGRETEIAGEVLADNSRPPGETFRDCDDCPELVVVPAGSFMMGSPEGEVGRNPDEGLQHRVTIAEPFAVGVYEVTFDQWDACVADGGCDGHRPSDNGWGRGQRPVVDVSWHHAQSFVDWLSSGTGHGYRLPSEAEWEYSARAGSDERYWTGDEIKPEYANFNGNVGRTIEVGSLRRPNAFGLHDVHGNVWEWVEDCWNDSYAGAPGNGTARRMGECNWRVLRGGSWHNGPGSVRSASRNGASPDDRFYSYGFRVARALR